MAATLVQETGAGLSNANTYLTLAEYATYLDERGFTDSTSDDVRTGRIIQAKDWIESQDSSFQGTKGTDAQALLWPRYGSIYVHGYYVDSSTIPQLLKDAQAQLVYDSLDTDIYNVSDGTTIQREKVDVIEVEFGSSGNYNAQPVFEKVKSLLQPLFKNGGMSNVVIRA